MIGAIGCPYFRRAFGWCVPIGGLAGLIGLGGGEFRLPILMHGLRFDAKSAVPLNLMISLVTLSFAMRFPLRLSSRICRMSPGSRSAVWSARFAAFTWSAD
jgi:hypothetical protein